MREIKVKAWDKRQKQMSATYSISDLTQYEHTFEVQFKHLACFADLIWLEYTGLKDKNGVEVYAGDIYRQKGMDSELITGTIVYYDDLSYCCREGDYIYHRVKFAGEVIGNIWYK